MPCPTAPSSANPGCCEKPGGNGQECAEALLCTNTCATHTLVPVPLDIRQRACQHWSELHLCRGDSTKPSRYRNVLGVCSCLIRSSSAMRSSRSALVSMLLCVKRVLPRASINVRPAVWSYQYPVRVEATRFHGCKDGYTTVDRALRALGNGPALTP